MTDLKMLWLFIFFNYAAFVTAAQHTNPATLDAESHTEALSRNNLEVHVKGNLSGHVELSTLDVITPTFPDRLDPTTENNEASAEPINAKTEEESLENPFVSEETVEYSSEDESSNVNIYIQSVSPLSYTDNYENDEEAAAKELTDGFKSNDVINGFKTSGNFVAINEEHGSGAPVTKAKAPSSENYNFMNDANKKEYAVSAADEGISTTEANDEQNLFTESDEESDESLFELNDPTEENWFGVNLQEEVSTYSPSKTISELESIRQLLTETTTELPLDLTKYSVESNENVNEQQIERKLENNEAKLEIDINPDSKDISTIIPSADYKVEEINDSEENIENSDSLNISKEFDTAEIITESSKDETEIDLSSGVENNREMSLIESNEEHSINQENVEEYIREDVETASTPTILFLTNTEEPQSKSKININEEDGTTKVSILGNNEELAITTASSGLSIETIDEDSASEVASNSIEREEGDLSFSPENPNEYTPTETNEDRTEKEIEIDSVYANSDENVSHIFESTNEASIVKKNEIFPATTTAFIGEAKKVDTSENYSYYTEEDSTEILPANIKIGLTTVVDESVPVFNPILHAVTEPIMSEKVILNENKKLPIDVTVSAKQDNLEAKKIDTSENNSYYTEEDSTEILPANIKIGLTRDENNTSVVNESVSEFNPILHAVTEPISSEKVIQNENMKLPIDVTVSAKQDKLEAKKVDTSENNSYYTEEDSTEILPANIKIGLTRDENNTTVVNQSVSEFNPTLQNFAYAVTEPTSSEEVIQNENMKLPINVTVSAKQDNLESKKVDTSENNSYYTEEDSTEILPANIKIGLTRDENNTTVVDESVFKFNHNLYTVTEPISSEEVMLNENMKLPIDITVPTKQNNLEAKKVDTSENNSYYTEEDSTEILPTNINIGLTRDENTTTVVDESVSEFNPTLQNFAYAVAEPTSSEEVMLNENMKLPIDITVSAKQNNLEDIVEKTTIEYNENNQVSQETDTEESNSSEDEKLLKSEKTVTITMTSLKLETNNLEIADINKIYDSIITSNTADANIEDQVDKTIPVFETSEEFDIVEPEGFSSGISNKTNLSSILTDSVENKDLISSFEGDINNTGNISIENQSKGYSVNTENSSRGAVGLYEKAIYTTALETNDLKLVNIDDSSTITNKTSDEPHSVQSEEYDTEENHEGNSKELSSASSEASSVRTDRTLGTDTAPKEEVTEVEITLEPTTEVNSEKTILSEESDSVESEEYEKIREESSSLPSEMSSNEMVATTLDTETAPTEQTESNIILVSTTEVNSDKTILSGESNSVESKGYATEENYEGNAQEAPSNGKLSDTLSLINQTERVPSKGIYEINNFLTALETNDLKLDNIDDSSTRENKTSDESHSVPSEEYNTEENDELNSEELPSSETFSVRTDRSVSTYTVPKEEESKTEITLEPTTEVNSEKTILSEESDSVESDEYEEMREASSTILSETPSTEMRKTALGTETAPTGQKTESDITLDSSTEVNSDKIILSGELNSVESKAYATEMNYEGISHKAPPNGNFSLKNQTKIVPPKVIYEIKNLVTANSSVEDSSEYYYDQIMHYEETVGSEEYATENTYEGITKVFPSNENFSDISPTKNVSVKGIIYAIDEDEKTWSDESDLADSAEYVNYDGTPIESSSERHFSNTSPLIISTKAVLVKGIHEANETSSKPNNGPLAETDMASVIIERVSKEAGTKREIILEPTTEVTSDKSIQSEESVSVENEEYVTKENIELVAFEPITVATTDIIINNTLNEVTSVSQNVNDTKNEVVIRNGTLDIILNYIYQRILTNIQRGNLTENGTRFVKDKDNAGKPTEAIDKTDTNVTEYNKLNATIINSYESNDSEEDITEEDVTEEDITEEDISEEDEKDKEYEEDINTTYSSEITKSNEISEISSDEKCIPYIFGKAFEGDVNISIKIVAQDATFYVPSSAYLLEDFSNLVLNVTWASSNKILNNSLSLTLTQISKYYVINGVQLNIVRDNDMSIWKKNVVILPKKTEQAGEYDCVIVFEDGVEVSISNIDFLSKSSAKENKKNDSDVNLSTSEMKKVRIYQVEIAVGCVAIALMVAVTIYFAIKKSRTRSIKIKNLSVQHVAV